MNSPHDVNEFKADVDVYKVRAKYNYRNSQADDATMEKPATFEYKKWNG